jgi:hypothetical protein
VLELIGWDAEEALPEEDALILEDLARSRDGLTAENVRLLSLLSFWSEEEVQKLRAAAEEGNVSALIHNQNLSKALREVLRLVQDNRAERIQVSAKQTMVIAKDVRYRWRMTGSPGKVQMGALVERDAGEPTLVDFGSGYLSGEYSRGRWIVGDHQIIAGYGLLLWRSTGAKKGFETVTTLLRPGRGLQPYRSSHEAWNLRGVGITWVSSTGEGFLSLGTNPRDGYLDSTGAVHVQTSGFHGSTGTAARRNLRESTLATGWLIRREQGRFGVLFTAARWGDGQRRGPAQTGYSCYGSWTWGSWTAFGEWARGPAHNTGALLGLRLRIRGVTYLAAGRVYAPGFTGLRANPWSEWGGTERNERGLYQGIVLRLGRQRLTLYGDLYRRAAAEDGAVFPRQGQETALRWEGSRKLSSAWLSHWTWRVQWKREVRDVEDAGTFLPAAGPDTERRRTVKVAVRVYSRSGLSGKLQVNRTRYGTGTTTPEGTGMELLATYRSERVTITVDWVTTRVEAYPARVYFWDLNLPGEMRSRGYAADGQAPGLLVLYRTRDGFQIGGKVRLHWNDLHFADRPTAEGALLLEFGL